MDRQLSDNEIKVLHCRKERTDKGERHRASKHGGFRVGQYDLAGRLEVEFDSLIDAVENNKVGATYNGILACCLGKSHKHRNKFWRKETDNE